jgi:hypothetical protein
MRPVNPKKDFWLVSDAGEPLPKDACKEYVSASKMVEARVAVDSTGNSLYYLT